MLRRGDQGLFMVRLGAIFIVLCMALIAGSLAVVLYFRFGLGAAESSLVGLGALTALALYSGVSGRKQDRTEMSDQVASLARGADDLARQLGEFGRRLNIMETKLGTVVDKALATAQPLAAEIEELSRLVKELAESVAAHDATLARSGTAMPTINPLETAPALSVIAPETEPRAAMPTRAVAIFAGLDRDAIIALLRGAIEAHHITLYLQPIVTLPQRKVRYYEAMSRLKADSGEVVAAADFLPYAEAGSLMPKLDALSVLRCVQVVRRLLLKNRDIGLFCNLSGATLTDAEFPQFLEFVDANRAIASALVFEFTQSAVRAMGPLEHESLAALAERGFRFSMDNLTDLRVEPRELNERGFRFIKVSATLLLNRVGAASTDIHPADFSDLLGRFGIDLIAERIESESTVVDLLDYDVRFGQGCLFSPPRPVRAEALQGAGVEAVKAALAAPPVAAKPEPVNGAPAAAPPPAEPTAPPPQPAPVGDEPFAAVSGALAQFARAGNGRG
jgi:cyclic-di-GMP phosphodiesterase, flagellum assembly factor TipF